MTPQLPATGPNAVVIRLSDSSAYAELHNKVIETADRFPDLPGATALRELGASPLTNPDKVNGYRQNAHGFHAVRFIIPGTATTVLMALGSATKVDLGVDDNQFVQLLGDTLAERRYESVWVADFARLLRSIDYFSATWKSVRTGCRYVRHGGGMIDTASENAEIQFLFEAISAAADARIVVRRTTNGRKRAYLRGEYPFAKSTVPLGYQKTRDNKLALARPEPKQVIRTIVQVLGDEQLTDAQRIERVGAAGATSIGSSRNQRRKVGVHELRNPGAAVKRWYDLIDVWRRGEMTIDYDLPSLIHNDLESYPIEIFERAGNKIWRLTYQLDLPDGGWATDDEFDAAEKVGSQRKRQGAARGGISAGHRRMPFLGLPGWISDGHQYQLLSHHGFGYELRRRPAEAAWSEQFIGDGWRRVARGWGRRPSIEGEVVALMDCQTLHSSIINGLVDQATRGLPLKSASAAILGSDTDDALIKDLRGQLTEYRRQADNAHTNSVQSRSEAQRTRYLAAADQAEEHVARLEQEVVRLVGASSGERLPVDAQQVAKALAPIIDVERPVPGDIADALRTVVSSFRLEAVGDTELAWEATLAIPLAGGRLILGPARGTLPNGLRRSLAARRNHALTSAEGAARAAQLVMEAGHTVHEVGKLIGITTERRIAQATRDHLKGLGMAPEAAIAMLDAAPPPARRCVWERLHGRAMPAEYRPAYANHVATSYLDTFAHHPSARSAYGRNAAALIDQLTENGGWLPGTDIDLLCQRVGISRKSLRPYFAGRGITETYTRPAILQQIDGGLGLRPCPHADCSGWADRLAILHEVPTHLLCPRCLRVPDPDLSNIVFPDTYLNFAPAT